MYNLRKRTQMLLKSVEHRKNFLNYEFDHYKALCFDDLNTSADDQNVLKMTGESESLDWIEKQLKAILNKSVDNG